MTQRVLHNRIAVMRVERAISRKELAEAVGVNVQTIGFLERGDYNPSLELGMKIAAYFSVPVEIVFSFERFEPLAAQLVKAKEPVAS
jgi:DNA-binding XRE family transcriptional regulator